MNHFTQLSLTNKLTQHIRAAVRPTSKTISFGKVAALSSALLLAGPVAAENVDANQTNVVVGNMASQQGNSVDGWTSNMVVNAQDTYTNDANETQLVQINSFNFYAHQVANPVTPFVVKVHGDNDFEVVAIGDTRSNYSTGENNVAFASDAPTIELAPGEVLATGFLDADANGLGGAKGSVIPFTNGGDAIWYTGGWGNGHSGAVQLGQAPVKGHTTDTNMQRSYQYNLQLQINANSNDSEVSLLTLGHDASVAGDQVDGWKSNMVIDEDAVWTNTDTDTKTLRVSEFAFHAAQVADPVTPFVVKVNGDNQFTVLAIGTTRFDYVAGMNTLAFSDEADAVIEVAAGETIAVGFMDDDANGSAGGQGAVISYHNGGSEIWQSGGGANDQGALTVGEAPLAAKNVVTTLKRDYRFEIQLEEYVAGGDDAQFILGNDSSEDRSKRDGWTNNLIVNQASAYTNDSGDYQTLTVAEFSFFAFQKGDPVTPFVVKWFGDHDYEVVAIGETQSDYQTGQNTVAFARDAAVIELAPGETILTGFTDSNADGSGDGHGAVIPFNDGGDAIFYTGGYNTGSAGSLYLHDAPVEGDHTYTDFQRSYAFNISFTQGGEAELPEPEIKPVAVTLGNDADSDGSHDGWKQNMVIDQAALYTNASDDIETLTLENFNFYAHTQADPVTPFLVLVHADGDFTVLEVGDTVTDYQVGLNNVPFAADSVEIELQPGDTVAPGFLDAYADGSQAGQGSVIPFTDNGNPVWYTGSYNGNSGSVVAGEAPDEGKETYHMNRTYHFNLDMQVLSTGEVNPEPPQQPQEPEQPQNTAPKISGKPATRVTVGNAYSFTPSASDADGDSLSFTIKNQPDWANFDSYTGRLWGTPNNDDAGNYGNIQISVSDGMDSDTLSNFNVEVVESHQGGLRPSGPIVIENQHNIVISGLKISNPKGSCIEIRNSSNVTIKDSEIGPCLTGKTYWPNNNPSDMPRFELKEGALGVYVYNSHGVTIENNLIEDMSTGVYAIGNSYNIHIRYNDFVNALGPYPRGQAVQFNSLTCNGCTIENNSMKHELYESYPEDVINMYHTSGKSGDPLVIRNNHIVGGGPSMNGGGIMVDEHSNYIHVTDNTLVDPGQYGVAIAGGIHDKLLRNTVYARATSFTNVGIHTSVYIDGYVPCHSNEIRDNKVWWMSGKTGKTFENPKWKGQDCSSGLQGWDDNEWKDHSLNPAELSIVPAGIGRRK